MPDHVVVFVTAESEVQARDIGRALVERRLAACANLAPVQSIFAWQGQIEAAEQDKTEAAALLSRALLVARDAALSPPLRRARLAELEDDFLREHAHYRARLHAEC